MYLNEGKNAKYWRSTNEHVKKQWLQQKKTLYIPEENLASHILMKS